MGFLSDIAGSVIGGVLGGGASVHATNKTNDANERINERNLQFAQNATKIRVDDMRNAGINPMLAANPGQAAQAPQQIGAQKPDVGGAISSAASIGGNLLTKREQVEALKTDVATRQVNSAAQVAKTDAEIENLHTQNANLVSQNRLLDEQATTQAAQRALMAQQGGMYSAQQAGTILKNKEQQLALDHWGTPTGHQAFTAGLDARAGGMVGQGLSFSGILNNALQKIIGPREANASRIQQIDNELKTGQREKTFSMPGLRITKEK